ncbi:hypothetical protein HK097_010178 [Rhizophlyctis rosea]|uniref:Protein phosphatase 1 regulatory subunit 35 C-terminal domain-containing protein n=1 Tax=Rhizophlyctis rosea TaxID=64517 RepID=A0AAD5SAS2_9FUNG|nr:hypothetical protein HK097_010178 [Rhizophlyctis rosea]
MDPRLIRPPKTAVTEEMPSAEADEDRPAAALSKPKAHSSKLLQLQMRSVRNTTFDPQAAMAALIHTNRPAVKEVQARITTKALNVNKNKLQYTNLVSVEAPTVDIGPVRPTLLPRARKSVSRSNMMQDSKPSAAELCGPNEEVDIVSLEFPKLMEGPFAPGPFGVRATLASVRTEVGNGERMRRMVCEKPVRCEDFVLEDGEGLERR